ncbi:alkaline phosphatase [Zhouia sp. PK063]|uniref:alkaline phosphatase n=1 Tax=Zhouia sp. PK063 TaxID=3373602 RepID=UPI0037947B91
MKQFLLASLFCISAICTAQHPIIHSHNDYEQSVPFWNAFSAGLHSIEVDVFLKDGKLYATHSEATIIADRTIENLYLKPLQEVLALHLGEQKHLQLLIDVKSDAYKTLDALVQTLERYPTLIQSKALTFAISGSRPKPEDYQKYPAYIQFDYQSLDDTTPEAWNKVALISLDYHTFTDWNGKGRLTKADETALKQVIAKAHSYHKLFRFWGAPDSKTAWKTFTDLGIDFINTDHPYACASYMNSLPQRTFTNQNFSKVYYPSYKTDGKKSAVKNVILLIGDGNGLSEISAAVLANGGATTLSQLKKIGLLKTSSSDDFTTDSAAAGTALSTGEKTYNRAIGVDSLENSITNITEILADRGFVTGVITTDDITGATPAAFYAHQKDRGMETEIRKDLLHSKLDFFAGGGKSAFQNYGDFVIANSPEEIAKSHAAKLGFFLSDKGVAGVLQGRKDILAQTTKSALQFLEHKNKPFFIMVEGAQIDSNGHTNNVGGIVSEGIDFDKAITTALQFADTHEGTLVLVTADHETSGFSIPQGDLTTHTIEGDFTTHDHTATMVPIFAYGPYSDMFTGVYENNEVFKKLVELLKQ